MNRRVLTAVLLLAVLAMPALGQDSLETAKRREIEEVCQDHRANRQVGKNDEAEVREIRQDEIHEHDEADRDDTRAPAGLDDQPRDEREQVVENRGREEDEIHRAPRLQRDFPHDDRKRAEDRGDCE